MWFIQLHADVNISNANDLLQSKDTNSANRLTNCDTQDDLFISTKSTNTTTHFQGYILQWEQEQVLNR